MTFIPLGNVVIPQAIADVSTTKKVALGRIIQAEDPTYGVGEFIYVKGVANGARYAWATYNADDWSTTLLAADAYGPCGIMQADLVANTYGWLQISGKGPGKALASYADNGRVYATSTAGSVDDAVVDGDMVHLAKGASAVDTPSTGLAEFEIHRPYNDDIAGND